MYEDNEKKINWLYILKKLVMLVIALIIIFGLVSLVTRCSKKDDSKKVINPEPVSLKAQIDEMQDATIKYLTKDSMPIEINKTKNIKLKYLMNKNLIGTLKDSNNVVCDVDASYSEITKLENNYALKTTLTCGKKTEYKVIYIGCFDNCKDGDICKSTNSKINGICGDSKKETSKTTTTKKNNTTKNSSSSKTTTTKKVFNSKVLYEYKRVVTKVCKVGLPTNDGKCQITNKYLLNGTVVTTNKAVENTIAADVKTANLSNPSKAVNTKSTTYELVKLDVRTGMYIYNVYTCSNGTISGKSCVIKTTTKVNSCKDKTFTYNSNTNTCTKEMTSYSKFDPEPVYEYTWSSNKNLGDGWVKTGNVK